MKKSFAVVYTICVVVILLGVIAYFGWDTYESRAARINDFETRVSEYSGRLVSSLEKDRDVRAEVDIAEDLLSQDPSLIAVQVYSHDDGLRLSVVKGAAEEFSRAPLSDSDRFLSFPGSIRYTMASVPMDVADMKGLEAFFVAATLSGAEIRSNLLIILVTVAGLFAVTLVLIILRPGRRNAADENGEPSNYSELAVGASDIGEYSFDDDSPDDDEFGIPDFSDEDKLDESDLLTAGPDFAESLPMDDDFSLPDLDDFPSDTVSIDEKASEVIARLDLELDRAASFNQDLSLVVFTQDSVDVQTMKGSFAYDDLVFSLGDSGAAVIELNKDLDSCLAHTEEFVRGCIDRLGNRSTRAGIASRNGRLISAERLYEEAQGALSKTDAEKNIVAFRSDPEKYREYLRDQQD